ncbi:GumC family protein [Arundinibacter roseus]|uniref:non-specific protein-tyrosine kinase n=1 Tax=Arundinibacter roseus TaxID=2070510 RepID=A0A4R4K7P9_9BACT|nr:tyrosine-protein kinase [Arundinibacter roseus]TDB63383.1 polysaccharide biosynthesis tyrosine autokinase [Arundinibacter roseus]
MTTREEYMELEEQEFNLQEYLRRYLRYWYLFPVFIGLTLTAAYFYLQITQPVYSTKATLLIKDEKKGLAGGSDDILSELTQFSGNKLVENEIEVLASLTLIAQVVENLGLEISYDAPDGLHTIDLYKGTPIVVTPQILTPYAYTEPMYIHLEDSLHFRLNDEKTLRTFGQSLRNEWGLFTVTKADSIPDLGYSDLRVHFHGLPEMAENVQERLTVQQPNVKSTVLELSMDDTSPQRGRDILNSLLDVYVQSNLNDKNREASNTLKFIEDRLSLLTGELGEVEGDVASYKSSQGLTDISSEAQIYLESIQENDTKLNEVNTQLNVLNDVNSFLDNANSAAPPTYMVTDPVLVSLLTRLTDLQLQQERYARTTQANNPLLETVNTQIANTKQAIRENTQNLRRGLSVTKQNLESINTKFSAGLRTMPQKEREYVGIKRQQTIKENLYLYLLQKREETALAYASTVTDSRLVDAPKTAVKPVKPKKALIALGAGAAGLVIPLLLINLLFMLNNTVQRRDEIETATRASVMGEIGLMKSAKAKEEDSIIRMTSRSAVAEQFRALRTNLQYLGDGTCRTLLFTSSIGGEGKSFVTINLGASLAYSDKKVIVVGLDLRKPTLHQRLGIPNDRGATNYFIGQGNLNNLIQTTTVHPNLDVLVSGPVPPNPSELLSNGRLPKLLAELRQKYDYILIDAPPFGLVTDAALIAEHADATLYVVRFNYTLRDHLRRIAELQQNKRFNNLSIIFNGVNYGAGYGYGYGYGGYGYGYYADEKEGRMRDVMYRMKRMVGKA